jgi:hypothetical protein
MAGSSPVPGMRHRRRAYLPGRQLCGPWQHQPQKPPSKRPIIIEDIIGTVAITGTAGTDGTVGTDGTDGTIGMDGTGIIFGFHIIGSKLGRRRNLKKCGERKAGAGGPAFLSIIQRRHGFRKKRRLDRGAHIEHVREAVCSSVVNKKELYITFCDHAATPPGTKANGYSIFRPRDF